MAVVGWGFYRAPAAFERATAGGIDVRALVELTLAAPGTVTVALAAATAAVVWPAFFPDTRAGERRRSGYADGTGNGGLLGRALGAAFAHRTGIAVRHRGTGDLLGRLIAGGIFELPNPFAVAYRLVRHVVHAAVRVVVFLPLGLAGLVWYERPAAFAAATADGVDLGAILWSAPGTANFLPVLGGIVLAAVLWPLLVRGGSGNPGSYDDGGSGGFGGFGGDGGDGDGE